jgi:large subunit ribosomal protein L24
VNKIKKDDEVIVITGRNKGKRGKVLRVINKKVGEKRNVYADVNIIKKHKKPNPRTNEPGGIITKESPIHVSNIAIYNPLTKKADKVGFKSLESGKKVRFYKSNNELIDI